MGIPMGIPISTAYISPYPPTKWHCPHSAAAAAAAADRRPTGRAAIDQYLLTAGPTATNLLQRHATVRWGETDGRTSDSCVDPRPHTGLLSMDFVVNRFFMKLFKTSNINNVKYCQECFSFDMPSDLWRKID